MICRKRFSKIVASALIIAALICSVLWADVSYELIDSQAYSIKNVYKITNNGEYTAYDVKVKVLIGEDGGSPYQKNLSYQVEPYLKTTHRDSYGNIWGELDLGMLTAGESKTVTIEKSIENSGISYSDKIYRLYPNYDDFKSVENNLPYLSAGSKIEVNADEIIEKAEELDSSKTVVERARDIYDFVNLYIDYDDNSGYSNQGALSALKTAKGVCYEYAALFTALCRAQGIPARIVMGYWVDEDLQTNQWSDISADSHAWAEFYLPTEGWVPVEPTFMYTYGNHRVPNHDYFANISADSRHFITSYNTNQEMNDISVGYKYYDKTSLELKTVKQDIMPISGDADPKALADIENNWAREDIHNLYNAGILFAKLDNLYEPSEDITRAEFAAFLVNTLGLDYENSSVAFSDVPEEHPYYSFIAAASSTGLINGCGNGTFCPDSPILRQDAAAIMARALKLLKKDNIPEQPLAFQDKDTISSYALNPVAMVNSMGIMTGRSSELFAPKALITRAETARLIKNFLKAIE